MTTSSRSSRDRGATLPIVAILLPVLILMTAFAVDLGRQRSSRRTMQARADIIALDLARLADGRTLGQILSGDVTHQAALVALAASASRNEVPVAQIDLPVWGTWNPASGFIGTTVTTAIPNAVQVTARETTQYRFQPGSGNVVRDAVAVNGGLPPPPPPPPPPGSTTTTTCCGTFMTPEALAGFSIGSFGTSMSAANAGLLNSTLTPILGSPPGVNALSYQGLAVATVGVAAVAAELGLFTPDDVLNTEVDVDDMMLATATVLRRRGDANSLAAATVLDGMASTPQTQNLGRITFGDIVSAEQGSETAAAGSTIDVLSMVQAAALLSQCSSDPNNVNSCSALAFPAISTSLPLLSSTGTMKIVQAPASAYGPVGTSARNSQVSTTYSSVIGAQSVGPCVPSLANLFCVLNGVLVGEVDATVTINATLKVADGTGTISAIDCGTPQGLDILTSTGLYDVVLDVVVDFGRRGTLGGLLGPAIGSLHLQATTTQTNAGQTITFDLPPDQFNVTTKQAGAGNVGLSTLALSTVGGTGALSTLSDLGIVRTPAQVISTYVNPLLVQLDSQVLGPLTDTLGINVIGADLTPQRIDCIERVFLVP